MEQTFVVPSQAFEAKMHQHRILFSKKWDDVVDKILQVLLVDGLKDF